MEDNFSIDQGLGEMVSGWFECFTFTVNFTSNLMLTLVWQEVLVHSLEVGYPCSKGLGCVLHSDFLRNWPYHLSYAISSRKWGQISNTPNICWFFRVCVCSVIADSLRPCALWTTRLLCPWDSPGKNTGVGCRFLLKGIFPTQGLNSPTQRLGLPL